MSASENPHIPFNVTVKLCVLEIVAAVMRLLQTPAQPGAGLKKRSDDELMQLAKGESHAAFSALVERHALRVIRLCSRLAGDEQLGQELAQDVWVRVWQRRDQYRSGTKFDSWLVTVALNHSRNHLRRGKVASRYQAAARLEADATVEQVDTALVSERRARLRSALRELPPAMSEALVLRYAEELRYDEMSAVVGSGESTLRSRVHHGLKALKDKLEKDL